MTRLSSGLLPGVVNLTRTIVSLFIVNPVQLAPADTAVACSLSYRAEQDMAEAEMLKSIF